MGRGGNIALNFKSFCDSFKFFANLYMLRTDLFTFSALDTIFCGFMFHINNVPVVIMLSGLEKERVKALLKLIDLYYGDWGGDEDDDGLKC